MAFDREDNIPVGFSHGKLLYVLLASNISLYSNNNSWQSLDFPIGRNKAFHQNYEQSEQKHHSGLAN